MLVRGQHRGQQVKAATCSVVIPMGVGLCPGCSTFDPAPRQCHLEKQWKMALVLGPLGVCVGVSEEAPGFVAAQL